jgi:hypothetical protein
MDRKVTLEYKEVDTLADVLNYIVNEGDREHDDFVERAVEEGLDVDSLFNEHDELLFEKVPKELKSHIYYKACLLLSELTSVTFGG